YVLNGFNLGIQASAVLAALSSIAHQRDMSPKEIYVWVETIGIFLLAMTALNDVDIRLGADEVTGHSKNNYQSYRRIVRINDQRRRQRNSARWPNRHNLPR